MLSDLGSARQLRGAPELAPSTRVGSVIYRAPENLLGMRYGPPVDIWQAACVLYEMLALRRLFELPANVKDEEFTALLLAQMVGLIGQPPADFVARSDMCRDYFHEDGSWKGARGVQIQSDFRASKLGHICPTSENEALAHAMFSMLKWKPEDRKTASELRRIVVLQVTLANATASEHPREFALAGEIFGGNIESSG